MTAAGAGRLLAVDAGRPLGQEPGSGHNRWHPDVPPLARVHAGERLVVETRDGIDGQVGPSTRPEDLLGLDMRRGHPLTGPIFVEEAAPGDLLEIEVLDVETAGFGFTCVRPGSGILGDRVRTPLLVRWDLSRGVARSSDLPGVAIPGGPFVGVIGLAPSHRRLAAQAERERELAAARGAALPPEPGSAVPASGEAALRGLRTCPRGRTAATWTSGTWARAAAPGSRSTSPAAFSRSVTFTSRRGTASAAARPSKRRDASTSLSGCTRAAGWAGGRGRR